MLRPSEGAGLTQINGARAKVGCYRSLFVAGALAQSPFCLVGGL